MRKVWLLFLLTLSLPAAAAPVPANCPCLDPERALVDIALPEVLSTLNRVFRSVNECKISPQLFGAENKIPGWLKAFEGTGENQIAPVVLERARAHYLDKLKDGKTDNFCYMAMDATKPHRRDDGSVSNRFYLVCESLGIFMPISSGHGGGVQFKDLDYTNDKKCVKNFGNAEGSLLTMGGRYLTSEVIYSYKGMALDQNTGQYREYSRPFINFTGEGEAESASQRDIGGHPAELIGSGGCFRLDPANKRADKDGFVYYGDIVDYSDGRSSGCTSWNPQIAQFIVNVVKKRPTPLYIYPESADIEGVAKASVDRVSPESRGLYWNKECLDTVGTPRFLPAEKFNPIFAEFQKEKAQKAAVAQAPAQRKLCGDALPRALPTVQDETSKVPAK